MNDEEFEQHAIAAADIVHAEAEPVEILGELFVPGDAAPQGSKRHVGGGRMVESSRKLGPWRERVALAAHAHGYRPLSGPVSVSLEFVRPRPVSTPKRSTPPAIRKPDADKLARAILDALDGIAYSDDAQVTDLRARKRLAEIGETPGVWIAVTRDGGAE